MGNMNRLSLGIAEACDACRSDKCEGCRICVDLGDREVIVNGKTRAIIKVTKKELVDK